MCLLNLHTCTRAQQWIRTDFNRPISYASSEEQVTPGKRQKLNLQILFLSLFVCLLFFFFFLEENTKQDFIKPVTEERVIISIKT